MGGAQQQDVVVVGGGIVGLATAYALLRRRPSLRLTVLEKETSLATHQTGRNSGVIHSGIYYPPGSLKARMVATGRRPLLDLCAAHGVPVDISGKLIVATTTEEVPRLDALLDNGRGHGLRARRLSGAELREIEPHAAGVAAVHVPETGVTDFGAVARAVATEVATAGGQVRVGCEVLRIDERAGEVVLHTSSGVVTTRATVVCAGLHADELAILDGRSSDPRIVPFRGEYYSLTEPASGLVRSLIYPVPDPRFPFLGVHLTRGVDGHVHAGPNAVLAFAREGYRRRDVDPALLLALVRHPGMRVLARRYWRTGLAEMGRSIRKGSFVAAARRLLPELTADLLVPAPSGVRAQAIRRDGTLVDDFAFADTRRVVHVVNAPSPAATAAIAIGDHLAGRICDRIDDC